MAQSMMASMPACVNCTNILSDADLNADIREIDVPTLIVYGSDDQLAPIAGTALRSAKIIRGAKLVVYEGRLTAFLRRTRIDCNAELLAFARTLPRT